LLSIEGFVQDISERRRAEAALRENELRYRQLFDLNPIPMWLYDCETLRFLEVNEAAIANYGYSREEFAQMTLLDIRSPEDVPALLESVARVTQGRDDARILRHHRTRDGQEIMVRITSHALITNGRRCEIVSALNVTDQLRAEQRMRESESTLRTIIESEPECVKLVDRSCCLQEMNPAGLRLIEAERIEDVRGACVLSLVAERHREAFETMCRAVFRGEAQRLEFEMIGLNGMHRILDTHSVPLWNADHTEVRAMLGVTRDVTERKHSEAALRASEERQRLALEATQWASGAST
jgi:PAS domain S-box-containing protein